MSVKCACEPDCKVKIQVEYGYRNRARLTITGTGSKRLDGAHLMFDAAGLRQHIQECQEVLKELEGKETIEAEAVP